VDLDAEHRALVSIVQILRARAASPLPAGDISECAVSCRRIRTRMTIHPRPRGDVSAEVRDAMNQTGYSLLKIGLSLSAIPKP
jgi:hypothetical protein